VRQAFVFAVGGPWSAGAKSRSTSLARIVLAVVDGEGTSAVSRRLGVSRPTVILWRDRRVVDGLAGLVDAERSGRPKTVDDARIITATLDPSPSSG
jgi:transposase